MNVETNSENVKNQRLKALAHGTLWLLIPIFTMARISQAWIATIYDWDTAELLIDADLEDRTPANFANIAHPYALVIFSVILRLFKNFGCSPRMLWFVIMASLFLLTVGAIYWVTRRMSQSHTWALVLTSFYVISPSTHEILARQEENLLYHLPFVLTVYFLSRLEQYPEEKRFWRWGIGSLFAVAVCHFQPSATLMIGIGLWLGLYLLRTNTTKEPQQIKRFVFLAAIPGLLLAFLFVTGLMAYVPYHHKWYSIFTVVDISNYIQVYFNSFQHFMFTKMGGFGKLHSHDYYVFSSFWIGVGVVLFVVTLFISLKDRRVPACVFWGALIFIALYEPNIEERWDVILLSMICMLASYPKERFARRSAWGLVAFMYVMAPGHASDAWAEWDVERTNFLFVEQQMKGEETIYGSHEGLRRIVMEIPYGVSYKPFEAMKNVSQGRVMIQHQEERDYVKALGKKIWPAEEGCYRTNHCRIFKFTTP